MLNRDFASGKAKPRFEETHIMGRDSLSHMGGTVHGPDRTLLRCKTIPI